jgi:uncharacterized membrane protein YqaE (UPF0057 family)
MSIWRVFLSIIFPPLAVLDKGCGVTLIVFILTMAGWFPGIIAALAINAIFPDGVPHEQRFVQVPVSNDRDIDRDMDDIYEKPKRKGAYVRLSDGEIAEVIDDDGVMPDIEKRKRLSGL